MYPGAQENMFPESPVDESDSDLDYVLGNLSIPHDGLRPDERDVSGAELLLAFDSITFNGHSNLRDDATRDDITADSFSGVDPFGQRPDMGKDTNDFNSAANISAPFSEADCEGAVLGEIDEALQSRQSSYNKKSNQINEAGQTSQIYTEINENNSVDFGSMQISRRRRSLSENKPRSVAWGSVSKTLPDFEEPSAPGPSLGNGKTSRRRKDVKKSRNPIKDQDDKQSPLKGCTPSGRISLKIKIGNKPVQESFDSKGNNLAEELPGNMVLPVEIKLEKVTSTDASVLENPSFNPSSYHHQRSSQAVGADLIPAPENRCSDIGTSPDSEVINSVPDALPLEKVSQSTQDVPIISNNACASAKDISGFTSSTMKSKNGAEATVSTEGPELGRKSTKFSTTKGKKEKAATKKGNKSNFTANHQMNEAIDDSAVPSNAENHLLTGNETPSDHGESGALSKDSSEATDGDGLQFTSSEERNAWVLCDECGKWRRIPTILADQIDETNSEWTCKDNTDKDFAACSIPQEKSNSEINKELEIPDEEAFDTLPLSKQNKSKATKKSPWSLIKSNLFLHRNRKKQPIDEVMVCHCKIPSDGKMGCGEQCLNRVLNIECVKGTCPCGERCSNQQFQKRKYAKLECFKSGKKGYGLQSLDNISEGQFLIEYVGEVLDMHAYEARQKQYAMNGHKHFYFMTLNGSEVIDACVKGNLGRFINHSCNPNCRTEKWMVNGEVCVGLFAIRDIKKGEEVTFDYNYVRVFGAAAKKCVCGSLDCRGYIGGDPTDLDIIVQSDSDDEDPEPLMVMEDGEMRPLISDSITITDEFANRPPENRLGMKERVSEVTRFDTVAAAHISETLQKVSNEGNFEEDNFVKKIYTGNAVEELDLSTSNACTFESNEFQSQKQKPPSYEPCESLLDTVEHTTKLKYDVGGKGGFVEPSTVVKTKRSSSSSKKGKIKVNVKEKGTLSMDRLKIAPNKSKKQLQSVNGQFEAVEGKLNELLESEGGISKRKDASKGYLKLLFLTAASGNNVKGETIQSNRDLSMILDALLKTKSRSVLVDIINKNGLQMLHNIMKRCRKEFNKTPILRKLLKVLEYLAMREILTLEHIVGGPHRPGVESFKDSMLTLTEHLDKQVHQIARSFRDRWIPRAFRRRCFNQRDDWMIESRANPTHSKFSQDRHSSEKTSEPPLSSEIQSSGTYPSSAIDQPASASNNNNESSQNKSRKRKSRWDTPPPGYQYPNSKPKTNSEPAADDDKPPGFSSPCYRPVVPSASTPTNPFIKNAFGVLLGKLQPRFVSRLPVSYGVRLPIVQQFGAEASIGWGVPFYPFPPLPSYEKGKQPNGFAQKADQGKKHARTWGVDLGGNGADFQRGGSHCFDGRFRQQKMNHAKLPPPWVRMRNGWGSAHGM